MAWDTTKPANNSALVSAEIRANWDALHAALMASLATVPIGSVLYVNAGRVLIAAPGAADGAVLTHLAGVPTWGTDYSRTLFRAANLTITNTTTETAIVSGTVSAGLLNVVGRILVVRGSTFFYNNSGAAASATLRVKLGGLTIATLIPGGAVPSNAVHRGMEWTVTFVCNSVGTAAAWAARGLSTLANAGVSGGSYGLMGTDVSTARAASIATLDLTAALPIEVTGQLSVANVSVTLGTAGSIVTVE